MARFIIDLLTEPELWWVRIVVIIAIVVAFVVWAKYSNRLDLTHFKPGSDRKKPNK